MQNLIHVNPQTLTDSVLAAERFLMRQQEPDGCWRDYQLEPGLSEAWTTAVVLWSLACAQPSSAGPSSVNAALNALHTLQKPNGWGYNKYTAADADSTAWACRVLTALQATEGLTLSPLLERFIRADGSSQTFLGEERFGSWAGYHADVQPTIGNAMVSIYAQTPDPALATSIRQLRAFCMLAAKPEGWSSFWWTTDAYAIATNLGFLQSSGGIPPALQSSATKWLSEAPAPQSAFETAQYLMIALLTGTAIEEHIALLTNTQLDDGSWPSSTTLLVPPQFGENTGCQAFPDIRRSMSTAMALIGLKTVLAATRRFMN